MRGFFLDFLDRPLYPPYWKNGLLFLPLNRSVVLGPHETRGINLSCKFPLGSLHEYFVPLPNRQVTFLVKTDGVRIWGALKNFSAEPQQLMPRYDLLACRTSVRWFRVLDKGVLLIPEGRKGQGFCTIDQLQRAPGTIAHVMGTRSAWLQTLRVQFAAVLRMALGPAGLMWCAAFLFAFLFLGKHNLLAACRALQRRQKFWKRCKS